MALYINSGAFLKNSFITIFAKHKPFKLVNMFAKFLFLAIMYGIYWVCYQVLLKDVEKKTKIKIESLNRNSAIDAIALRKRLQKRRTILLIGIVFVSASVLSSLAIFTDRDLMSGTVAEVIVHWFILFFLGCFICSIPIRNNSKLGDEFFGNISLLTIDDVLSENKPFYLYLIASYFAMSFWKNSSKSSFRPSIKSGSIMTVSSSTT